MYRAKSWRPFLVVTIVYVLFQLLVFQPSRAGRYSDIQWIKTPPEVTIIVNGVPVTAPITMNQIENGWEYHVEIPKIPTPPDQWHP